MSRALWRIAGCLIALSGCFPVEDEDLPEPPDGGTATQGPAESPTWAATPPAPTTPPTPGETTPTLQGETTPTLQGETTPTLQGETTPTLQGETTPTLQGETTPTLQGETTPTLQGETTPTQGEATPTQGEATPTQGEATPTQGPTPAPTPVPTEPPTPTAVPTPPADGDGDGYTEEEGDCDDARPGIHPGAPEVCDPADTDEDCDGLADEDDPGVAEGSFLDFYPDEDEDGFGSSDTSQAGCVAPPGFVANPLDCDDTDPAAHPGAPEPQGDGYDNNCDGFDGADLNNDGWPDLVLPAMAESASDFSTVSRVYFGDGVGVDPDATSLPTFGARAACAADFNADGWMDLVFPGWTDGATVSGLTRVYWGGVAGFDAGLFMTLPTLGATDCVAEDFNQDGRVDLAVANNGDPTTREGGSQVFYATFDPDQPLSPPELLSTRSAFRIAAADLNGDGWLDLVLATLDPYQRGANVDAPHYVFLGGEQGFEASLKLSAGGVTARPAFGDFNGDGALDLALAASTSGTAADAWLYVFLGPELAAPTLLPANSARDLAAADLDQDGYDDLVVPGYYSQALATLAVDTYVYWGGPPGPGPGNRAELDGVGMAAVHLADLDGDGALDIALGSMADPDMDTTVSQVWYAEGGTYPEGLRAHFTGPSISALSSGWFNNDDHLELVASSPGAGTPEAMVYSSAAQLLTGSARGVTDTGHSGLPTVGARKVVSRDLNADGYLDLIFANQVGSAPGQLTEISSYIYWGGPTPYRAAHRTALPTVGAVDICVDDLDADGALDVVFAQYKTTSGAVAPTSRIYWGSEQGYSPARVKDLATFGAMACEVADLNNDGRLDLIFANSTNGTTPSVNSYVYLGDNARFSAAPLALPTTGAVEVAVANLDRSGWKDLIFSQHRSSATTYASTSIVYFGNTSGYGTTGGRTASLQAAGARVGALVADLDNNGVLDVIMPGYNDGDFSVKTTVNLGEINGSGWMAKTRLDLDHTGGGVDAALAEVTGDSQLDLILTLDSTSSTNTTLVYRGQPSGGFSLLQTLPGTHNAALVVTDLDQDGRQDLVVATSSDSDPVANSWLFPGAASGFATTGRPLPTLGAVDVLATDLDQDGLAELIFANSREALDPSDTECDSYVYWNREGLLSFDVRQLLPTFSSMSLFVAR